MMRKVLAALFVVGSIALILVFAPESKEPASPSAHHFGSPNVFLSDLRRGMPETEFNQEIEKHLFKDVFLSPIIVSLSDPNRHFDFPDEGPYVFHFDRERKLVDWRPWTRTGDASYQWGGGGLSATFSATR